MGWRVKENNGPVRGHLKIFFLVLLQRGETSLSSEFMKFPVSVQACPTPQLEHSGAPIKIMEIGLIVKTSHNAAYG